jgi:fatty-acyl-CoA synthase
VGLNDNFQLARRLGWLDPALLGATTAALARWGPTLAAPYAGSALRHPRRVAIVDHRGSVTYSELERRSTTLARGLRTLDLAAGDHLGVLCFNHAEFVEVSVAAAKAGLCTVYLNTGFAPRQLGEVLAREGVDALVCDAELVPVAESSGFEGTVIVADGTHPPLHTVAGVRDLASRHPLLPSKPLAPVLLTSGTTGTPKGARRGGRPVSLVSAVGLLDRIPYRSGDVTVLPTPLFHAWGLAQLTITASTSSTAVLVHRFTPDATLEAVDTSRASVLAVVPVMMQRILGSPRLDDIDSSSLRIVASSGSALPAAVALEWMDRLGDHVYNVYGSTEVGQATLATPADLRAAPGTAGRVIPGSAVEIVSSEGVAVGPGVEGRIMVGNSGQFSGYTGGGTREMLRGLMASGDVGYFDDDGRLFVTGRADDMIVSGGENVFPQEIEELLLAHPEIADAAVVGVPDEEFGQRLAARVVAVPHASIDEDAVRALVAGQLARHKVPRDVTFVDELPRTTTGKLLRRDLESESSPGT